MDVYADEGSPTIRVESYFHKWTMVYHLSGTTRKLIFETSRKAGLNHDISTLICSFVTFPILYLRRQAWGNTTDREFETTHAGHINWLTTLISFVDDNQSHDMFVNCLHELLTTRDYYYKTMRLTSNIILDHQYQGQGIDEILFVTMDVYDKILSHDSSDVIGPEGFLEDDPNSKDVIYIDWPSH